MDQSSKYSRRGNRRQHSCRWSRRGYPSVTDTAGEWQYLEYIGQTGPEQKSFGIGASLGGYSSLIQGKAYFDDFAVEKLDAAPEGANVISLDSAAVSPDAGDKKADTPHKVSPTKMLLISALFSVFLQCFILKHSVVRSL